MIVDLSNYLFGESLSRRGISIAFDCVPCQSLYHCTAWGLPFVALINGCKLVLPCEKFDGASLHALMGRMSAAIRRLP